MDLLRKCTSGVHLIDGFDAIAYNVFAVGKSTERAKRTYVARWELLDIEYNARRNGHLVTTDLKNLHLWTFEKAGASSEQTKSNDETSPTAAFRPPSDSNLQRIQAGQLLSSTLNSTPLVSRPNSPERFQPREVYSCFLSACLRSLSLQIAGQQNVIPLNCHTFTICNPSKDKSAVIVSESEPSAPQSSRIVNFRVDLLQQGHLEVTVKATEQENFRCIADIPLADRDLDGINSPQLVLIAPSSRLARKTWREELLPFPMTPGLSESASSMSPEWLFSEPQRRIWKDTVVQWLQWHGINFHSYSDGYSWVKATVFLKFPHSEDASPRSRSKADHLTLDWPAKLCFQQKQLPGSKLDYSNEASLVHSSHGGTEWFQISTQDRFDDPLQAAFHWMDHKSDIDSQLKMRKATRDNDGAQGNVQDLAAETSEAQSPLDARAMSYQDAQMIYPTPSDGLPAHVTPGSISFDNGPLPSSQVADTYSSPDMESGVAERKASSPGDAMDHELMNDHNYDAEDHYFEPTALTDADFDFFDRPDLGVVNESPDGMDVDTGDSGGMVPNTQHSETDLRVAPDAKALASDAQHATAGGAGTTLLQLQTSDDQAEPQEVINGGEVAKSAMVSGIESPSQDQSEPLDPIALSNANKAVSGEPPYPLTDNHDDQNASIDSKVHTSFDDHKYQETGRFSFLPRKRPRQSSVSQSFSGNMPKASGLFSSPTSIGKIAALKGLQSVRSKPPVTEAIYEDQDSESSDSESHKSMSSLRPSRNNPSITVQRSTPNIPTHNSTDVGLNDHHAENGRKPSPNQKFWAIEDFDALAGTMLMSYFKPSSTNWSTYQFLKVDSEAPYDGLSLPTSSSSGIIAVAQLVASQTSLSCLELHLLNASRTSKKPKDDQGSFDHATSSCISLAIDRSFPSSVHTKLDLKGFLTSPDTNDEDDTDIELFPIPPDQVRVQRTRVNWDLAASAPSFWEILGLEPSHGAKTTTSFVIYPWSDTIEASMDTFLKMMESAWLNQRLGSHLRGHVSSGNIEGLVAVKVEAPSEEVLSVDAGIAAFKDTCHNLGLQLKDKYGPEENIVIYLVTPFQDPTTVGSLCAAFWALVQAYNTGVDAASLTDSGNITLQIVPIGIIASVDTSMTIDVNTINSLAHSVYDRSRKTEASSDLIDLAIPSGASITLRGPVAEDVQFRLSTNPSSNVLYEDSCLHVGYCESPDRRWVAVSWTDDTGKYQHNASYHSGGTPLGGYVIKEIWETTLDIIKPRRVRWRIFVTKCGSYNVHEQKIWHTLASHSAGLPHKLSLIAVNTSPMLSVAIKPSVRLALMENNPGHTTNTQPTPVSTPHPTQQLGSSPAPSSPSNFMSTAGMNAATPSAFTPGDPQQQADADQATQLIDKADESWGIILRRRLNVAESVIEINPALASGYLMKRTGVGELDPPVMMEVNLMHSLDLDRSVQDQRQHMPARSNSSIDAAAGAGANAAAEYAAQGKEGSEASRTDAANRQLLNEILVKYRNLGLLARLRKIEGSESCSPWHIAVAMRAAEGLGRCLRG